MSSHIVNGQFQSDKYPTCPPGKVPLSVNDKSAQDLLWEYAQRRRSVDAEFADDLERALQEAGYVPALAWRGIATAPKDGTLIMLCIAFEDDREHPLDDTRAPSRTIGFNNFKNDGLDVWKFAGWCWSHDHFTEGEGTPCGWLPMPPELSQSNDERGGP